MHGKNGSGRLPPFEGVREQLCEQLTELARGCSPLHQATVRSSCHRRLTIAVESRLIERRETMLTHTIRQI